MNEFASERPAEDVADLLGDDEIRLIDAYWRAANYLSVGQIYLLDNPLLSSESWPSHSRVDVLVTSSIAAPGNVPADPGDEQYSDNDPTGRGG